MLPIKISELQTFKLMIVSKKGRRVEPRQQISEVNISALNSLSCLNTNSLEAAQFQTTEAIMLGLSRDTYSRGQQITYRIYCMSKAARFSATQPETIHQEKCSTAWLNFSDQYTPVSRNSTMFQLSQWNQMFLQPSLTSFMDAGSWLDLLSPILENCEILVVWESDNIDFSFLIRSVEYMIKRYQKCVQSEGTYSICYTNIGSGRLSGLLKHLVIKSENPAPKPLGWLCSLNVAPEKQCYYELS